ncbi:MAG TPA: SDR family oxidoreductase [Acidimicrobiia bacterium]|nr:SDR family oxidoreductase [Acidimicrobiia bacterium]
MELAGRVAVVTGGAAGIGRALCRRFAAEGASLVVADIDGAGAAAVAEEVGGTPVATDVSVEADVQHLVEQAMKVHGRVDLFCSNAGILFADPPDDPAAGLGIETSDQGWDRIWRVNFMAHVYAARAVLPPMLERGEGYLLSTASAAGLLTALGNAPYSVTKHAAVALAEWLAITYGEAGIKVSCLCPEGVRTDMLASAGGSFLAAGAIDPEAVADTAVEGLRAERFLILPHPGVADYFRRKAADYDRWLAGMRRLQQQIAIDPER